MRRCGALTLVLLLAAPVMAGAATPSAATAAWLLASVGPQLARSRTQGAPLLPDTAPSEVDALRPDGVVVRVHPVGAAPRRGTGAGHTLRVAFERAVAALAAADPTAVPVEAAVPARVGLDVYWRGHRIDIGDPALLPRLVDPAVTGLELTARDGRTVTLLPADFLVRGLVDRSGRLDAPALQRALDPVAGRVLHVGSWVGGTDPGVALPLRRGSTPPPPLDEESLGDAAVRAAAYLLRHQGRDGRFRYAYCARTDRSLGGYNWVRHAGVTWALLRLQRLTGDPRLLAASMRALRRLSRQVARDPDGRRAFVERDGGNVLGATALTLLAVLEVPPATQNEGQTALARELGRGLASLMHPSGRFWFSLVDRARGLPPPPPLPYYPGEALLALTTLAARDPDGPWLRLARRAAEAEEEAFEASGRACHWTVQGLAALGRLTRDRPMLVAAVTHARVLAQGQVTDDPRDPRFGAWGGPGRPSACATACRIEALGPALEAARLAGEDAADLERAVIRGARFLLTQQYGTGRDFLVRAPEAADGGIRTSTVDLSVRMDVNQHAIAALLRTLALVRGRPWLADRSGGPSPSRG